VEADYTVWASALAVFSAVVSCLFIVIMPKYMEKRRFMASNFSVLTDIVPIYRENQKFIFSSCISVINLLSTSTHSSRFFGPTFYFLESRKFSHYFYFLKSRILACTSTFLKVAKSSTFDNTESLFTARDTRLWTPGVVSTLFPVKTF